MLNNKNTMKKKGLVKEVTKKDLHCSICQKSGFRSTYKLNSHLFLHKAIPARHKCRFCPKEYFRSDEYSRHVASHMKTQKLYCCDHCGRAFVDKRNLIVHLNIHDDLPRFSDHRFTCNACGADYCEQRLLKYHIRKEHLNLNDKEPLHIKKKLNDTWLEKIKDSKAFVEITKIKPNSLKIKRSKVKSKSEANDVDDKTALQQYIASVFAMKDNSYSKAVCDYCGKEMLKKSILKHIRERHLKLRKFQCDVCNRTFQRHYQLCMHKCGVGRRRKIKNETKDVLIRKTSPKSNVKVESQRMRQQIKSEKKEVL